MTRSFRGEDIFTSLASYIVRFNMQITAAEWKEFQKTDGVPPRKMAQSLLDALDQDVIAEHAGVTLPEGGEPTPKQQPC